MTAAETLTLERDMQRAVELLEQLQKSGELNSPKLAALQKVLQSDFCQVTGAIANVN